MSFVTNIIQYTHELNYYLLEPHILKWNWNTWHNT